MATEKGIFRRISNHFNKSRGVFSSEADLRMKVFCKSTMQRLREARFKVELAKRDMEDILIKAKSESDLSSNATISSIDQRLALQAGDLAVEAEKEVLEVFDQFAEMVKREEERMLLEAEFLCRRSEALSRTCRSLSNSCSSLDSAGFVSFGRSNAEKEAENDEKSSSLKSGFDFESLDIEGKISHEDDEQSAHQHQQQHFPILGKKKRREDYDVKSSGSEIELGGFESPAEIEQSTSGGGVDGTSGVACECDKEDKQESTAASEDNGRLSLISDNSAELETSLDNISALRKIASEEQENLESFSVENTELNETLDLEEKQGKILFQNDEL